MTWFHTARAAWLSGFSLDLKLGVRMLVKYPGLTVVGGLAMAFGIWFGAVTFHMFGILTSTKLPLSESISTPWQAGILSRTLSAMRR